MIHLLAKFASDTLLGHFMRKKISLGELDRFDLSILDILQGNNRLPHSAIAEKVGLSTPSVQRRISKSCYIQKQNYGLMNTPLNRLSELATYSGLIHNILRYKNIILATHNV
jgi:hypothetical protein